MRKLLPTLFCLMLFLSSCIRTECKNCTKLFSTQLSIIELDLLVQDLNNDSLSYQDWNDFTNQNFIQSGYNVALSQTESICSKYGGMVSVDPLGDARDFRQVWYSNGTTDLNIVNDSIFEIGFIYFDCE